MRRGQVDDGDVDDALERAAGRGESVNTGRRVVSDMGRRQDLARIAADRRAVREQDLLGGGDVGWCAARVVPVIGPSSDGAQRPLPAGAADGDRRTGTLDAL